ncbi:MAG: branched-chain amino acid ABC transporter permease, partial [Deltaproteobacteria bacterium]|nr:branched-chain amino acid ABC transporter permease [Deltaproteobacteria bacterium]
KRKERIDRGIKVLSEDISALLSWREMLYLSGPRLLPILGLIVLPLLLPPYWQKVLLSVAIFSLLAMSWDILGQAGMVSLGQSLFFGVGAYLAGIMNHRLGLPVIVTIPIATITGGLICTAILAPVLKLRGIYFAMVTMILPMMLVRIIEATKIFGGTEGISGLEPIASKWIELYLVLAVVVVVLFGFRRLMGSDFGLVLKGIKDNDVSVLSSGFNIFWYKMFCLFLSASVGAFAGAFMSHTYMVVGMAMFSLEYSMLPIGAAVVGGVGTFAGSMLGAFILVPLSEVLRGLGGLRVALYGIFLLVFVVALPEGIFHYIKQKYFQFERLVEVER